MSAADLTGHAGFVALTRHEAATLAAAFARLWPAGEHTADAVALGALAWLDRALDGAEREALGLYRAGLPLLDRAARALHGAAFRACAPAVQDALLGRLERGTLPCFVQPAQPEFWATLRRHLAEALFSDPAHGGNRDAGGWRALGHPGVWPEHDAEETAARAPALKGGRVRTLRDHERDLDESVDAPAEIPGFDPQRGAAPPAPDADAVVVGVGGVGGLVAPWLAEAGLKVVALEAGPWHPTGAFKPDELALAFYARAGLGPKFLAETPRWRRDERSETVSLPFSLGRMCNGVGGSLLHYGARLRRLHPHHFRMRSTAAELGLLGRLPADCTLADWPLSYAELEPYYERLEGAVGVAGPPEQPFVPRRAPPPMPPTRPPACGALFADAARGLGLNPVAIPVGQNTVPHAGRPAMTYSPWGEGLGSQGRDRWLPTLDLLPRALAGGTLDLRTGCRVLRVLAGGDGCVAGVEYLDAAGRVRIQRARRVILTCYTFEAVRLLLLSGDARHPAGLGNNAGQVGANFMTKQYPSVLGQYARVFNRHTGPGAQGVMVEDFQRRDFLGTVDGFFGGGTIGTENQMLPIQIAREPLPDDVPAWGPGWQAHLRAWNHRAVLRIQTDTLPYAGNRLDLDPLHRDRSGLGLPVVRVTYDVRANERALYDWMQAEAGRLQRAMGASKIWRGPWFTGIGSCHDFGGCRTGDDPASAVVDRDLQVHDTPGLYVMGGAAFPSCHGVNPTLTIWALAARAVERIVADAARDR